MPAEQSREIYFSPEGVEFRRPKYWVARQQDRNRSIGKLNTIGGNETFEVEFLLSDLPDGTPNFDVDRDNDGVVDGFVASRVYIPPFASIRSVTIFTREEAAGGVSIDIGTFQFDGTPVDPAGFGTVTLSDIDAKGKRFVATGPLTVPATSSVGDTPVTIGLTATGEFTAGSIQINVDFELNGQRGVET